MKKTIGCCLSTLITIILLAVGIFFGGTYYLYASFAKPYIGISYGQTLGLLPGLYKANEEKLVTKPFNATTDLESFDSKLKSAMFLDQNSDFSVSKIISELLGAEPATQEEVADIEYSTVANNKFLEMLEKLNFDFSTLKGYDSLVDPTIKNTKGVLSVTDREIASFVDSVFKLTVLSQVEKSLNFGVKLEDVISIKQVIIDNPTEDRKDIRLTATVKADLKLLLTGILTNMGAGKYASLVANLLPRKLFATVVIAPYDTEVAPKFSLNEYSEEKMQTIFNAINSVLNYNKEVKEDKIDKFVKSADTQIKKAFNLMDTYVKMEFVADSANMDAINMMMTSLKLNANVSKEDFLTMISFLQCRDLSGLQNINYDKNQIEAFFIDFKNSYAIKNEYDINKDNFTSQLSQVHNQIDTNKIDFSKKNSELKAQGLMTYDALASLFESFITKDTTTPPADTPATENVSAVSNVFNFIKLRQISMENDVENFEKERIKLIIEVPFEAALKAMAGETNNLINFAMKVLPSTMFITAEVNLNGEMITNEAGELVRKYPADPSLIINDLDKEQSQKMLLTMVELIKPLLGESTANQFSYDKLCSQLGDLLTKGIEQIEKGATAINVIFNTKGMMLPTIYELVESAFKLKSDVIPKEEMPDEIRLAIKGIQQTEKDEFAKNIAFGSTDEHKKSVLADIVDKDNLGIVPMRVTNVETGNYNYFFTADTMIPLYDKIINQAMADTKINVTNAEIKLMQTMFVNTLTESEVLKNEFFKGLVNDSGFTGDLIIQTIEVKLMLNINNPVIPKSLFVTYVYNPKANDSASGVYMVINGMSARNTEILEGMINSAKSTEEKPFNFIETINTAINGYMDKDITINLPSVNVHYANINIGTLKLKPVPMKIKDIISNSIITNLAPTDEEYALGCGLFTYRTDDIELDFTESINEPDKTDVKIALDLYFDSLENQPLLFRSAA